MSLFKAYKTDQKLETEGVTFELYDNRITMARAGSTNPAFTAAMTKRTQPYRRQVARGELTPAKELEILRLVYADSIIQKWEVKRGEEWVEGIETSDGGVAQLTHDNVVKTLTELPDLFLELQALASSAQNYRAEQLEADAGN